MIATDIDDDMKCGDHLRQGYNLPVFRGRFPLSQKRSCVVLSLGVQIDYAQTRVQL